MFSNKSFNIWKFRMILFCGLWWIYAKISWLFFFSFFVKHCRNDAIPQKMTRPTPHWHPLLDGFSGFWSTRLAQDVTPKALLYHLQLQTLVSVCVLSQSTISDLIDAWTTHSFWTIFFTFLGLSGWIGCWQISSGVSFDSGTSDLKICNRCRNIFFWEIPIVAFPLRRLFLCS